ncbi:biotin transporter BioY [Alphaproteobacteria bacterium]|nr:biotin transporter BioY [Alphaproteobacteria bacterium]MDA9190396.1 biotin transporter BioY [Alphaproteobacteria bacterium]
MQILGASTPLVPAIISSFFGGSDRSASRIIPYLLLAVIGCILLTISAKIQIPFYPVPMTMQTLVVLLIGMSYGPNLAVFTLSLYLFQGALGIPVFASGAGVAYLVGPTGGFLAGFVISAYVLGCLASRGWGKTWQNTALAMLIGISIIFLAGISWLSQFIGLQAAIINGFLPFIYADFLKLLIATLVMPTAWLAANRMLNNLN